jgi:hypothetical protein
VASEDATTGRDLGEQLLAATARYDMAVVLADDMTAMVQHGSILRCRRLLRSAYLLADNGFGLEATILTRTITEYAITLAWIHVDPDYHLPLWGAKDLDMRLLIHNEVKQLYPEVDVLDDPERIMAERARLVAQVGERSLAMPSVKRRAEVAEDNGTAGMRDWYALPYRADSQAATHATVWGIEMLMEGHPETGGVVIHPEVAPGRAQVDVYRTAAHMFGIVVLLVANEVEDQALYDRVAAILDRLPPPSRPSR